MRAGAELLLIQIFNRYDFALGEIAGKCLQYAIGKVALMIGVFVVKPNQLAVTAMPLLCVVAPSLPDAFIATCRANILAACMMVRDEIDAIHGGEVMFPICICFGVGD